jgi:hypothetical protein
MSAPNARQGTSILFRVYVYDNAVIPRALYDPAGDVVINLRDPLGALVLTAAVAERESIGTYQYLYQLGVTALPGPWTADWATTNGAQVVVEPPFVAFVVVEAPAVVP